MAEKKNFLIRNQGFKSHSKTRERSSDGVPFNVVDCNSETKSAVEMFNKSPSLMHNAIETYENIKGKDLTTDLLESANKYISK